jgi:hypothetical protein
LAKITREVGKIIKRVYENGFILEVAKWKLNITD